MLWRLIKFLIFLLILSAIVVIVYAYVGPYFGANFSAPQTEHREPVILNGE